ncbi:16S rRNA (uracil(1498)-N(3))-methyltransferase [bacterium]|nr:16S rRNA (uracil(1498)-N(3))-methyltransferase [bacterium]
MRLTRIFHADCLQNITVFTLEGEAALHLLKVMRVRCGDEFIAFDNTGYEYVCEVESFCGKKALQARVKAASRAEGREAEGLLRICMAVVKGERFDWAAEKLTELGAAEIVPIITEFTQVTAPSAEKLSRWRRLAIEAACQCGRVKIPKICEPMSCIEAMKKYKAAPNRHMIIFCPGAELFKPAETGEEYTVFIGPEGGFSQAEEKAARENGAEVWGLGPRILRVETAALAAAARFLR